MRKGKKGPFKLLCKTPTALETFQSIGTTATDVSESKLVQVEKFVCAMYGKPSYSDVNEVRYEIFRSRYEMKPQKKTVSINHGVDLSLLPPCRTSLCKHVQRVN